MLKINLKLGLIFIITVLKCFSQAAIVPNANLSGSNNESAWLEFKPNGLLLLRGVKENSSSFLHEAMIFKTILNAIRLMPLQTRTTLNDLNQKMYGDGVEHKFPPFMERVIQRIQTYFSIYKYTDTTSTSSSNQQSTPLTVDNGNKTTTTATTNGSLNFDDYNEIDVNLTSTNIVHNNNNNRNKNENKTTIKPLTMKPTKTSTRRTTLSTVTTTTTSATTILDHNVENTTTDEENEFIEIKKNH